MPAQRASDADGRRWGRVPIRNDGRGLAGHRSVDAPTVTELLANPLVRAALEDAWTDSAPDDWLMRHEEGGWIYMDVTTGEISIRRSAPGRRATVDLTAPPVVAGAVV